MKSFEDAMLEVKPSDRKVHLGYDKRAASVNVKRFGVLYSVKENQKIDINTAYVEYVKSFK